MNRREIIKIKIFLSLVTGAALMFAVGTVIANISVIPQQYYTSFENGTQLLATSDFEGALESFENAKKLYSKSTQAMIGQAKAYLGMQQSSKASEVLLEAQKIDMEDEKLLIDSVKLLSVVDSSTAYKMLNDYVDFKGGENISSEISALIQSAESQPSIPTLTPEESAYATGVLVEFSFDEIKIGHKCYYTLDGKIPTEKSKLYTEPIQVQGDAIITVISYNAKGDACAPQVFKYTINKESKLKFERVLKTAKNYTNDTEIGKEAGNVDQNSMDALVKAIEENEVILNKTVITVDEAITAYEKMTKANEQFVKAIVPETDKTALDAKIKEAQKLLETAKEGSKAGQYKNGAIEELKKVLEKSNEIFADEYVDQPTVDEEVKTLTEAVNDFAEKRLTVYDEALTSVEGKTGKVTVTLLWNTSDELDLFITSPSGDTVNYMSPHSISGGVMDIDKQYASNGYYVGNAYWNNPPEGKYIVRVNVSGKKTSGSTSFKLRIISGSVTKTYSGSINTGTSRVCTFNY